MNLRCDCCKGAGCFSLGPMVDGGVFCTTWPPPGTMICKVCDGTGIIDEWGNHPESGDTVTYTEFRSA